MRKFLIVLVLGFSLCTRAQVPISSYIESLDTLETTEDNIHNYYEELYGEFFRPNAIQNLTYFEEVEKLEIFNNPSFKDHHQLLKGDVYKMFAEHGKSTEALNQISVVNNTLDNHEVAKLLALKQRNKMDLNLYKEAILLGHELDAYLKTHDVGSYEYAARSIAGLDLTYYAVGNYDKAIFHSKKSLEDHLKSDRLDHELLFHRYNNLGVFYIGVKKYDSALVYLNEALSQIPLITDEDSSRLKTYYSGLAKGNMANCHIADQDYKKAIPLIKAGIYGSKDFDGLDVIYNYLNFA